VDLEAADLKLGNEMKNFDYLLLVRVLSKVHIIYIIFSYHFYLFIFVAFKKSHPVDFLKACSQLLRDDGLVILIEPTKDHEIELMADALQGVDLAQIEANNYSRIYGMYFDRDTLERVITEAGFRIAFKQVE
jgi:SAM-dependent methyltransferase